MCRHRLLDEKNKLIRRFMRSPKLTLTIVSAILVLTGLVFIGLLSKLPKGFGRKLMPTG
jgi:hypothetical protein